MRITLLSLLLFCIAGIARAAEPPQWTVDQAHSALTFTVGVNGQTVKGRFPGIGALIRFDPASLAQSSVKATIDTTGIKTFDATRDAMLLKPAWFNVLDFPQAKFESVSFTANGPNRYICNGKLSIKGNVRDISLPFTLAIKGNTAVMTGETTIRRLDFHVGDGPDYKTETPVSLSVKVMVNIRATRSR
jgi:polyisoprenoid-binding protein YceI